jgi:hypothetical protein
MRLFSLTSTLCFFFLNGVFLKGKECVRACRQTNKCVYGSRECENVDGVYEAFKTDGSWGDVLYWLGNNITTCDIAPVNTPCVVGTAHDGLCQSDGSCQVCAVAGCGLVYAGSDNVGGATLPPPTPPPTPAPTPTPPDVDACSPNCASAFISCIEFDGCEGCVQELRSKQINGLASQGCVRCARFPTGIYAGEWHWSPRLLAANEQQADVGPMAFLSVVHPSRQFTL